AIIISTLLFSSFLCWASVIRYANHIGFLIGTLSYEVATTNQNSGATEMREYAASMQSNFVQLGGEEIGEDTNAKQQKRLKRFSMIDENCKKNLRRLIIAFRQGKTFTFACLDSIIIICCHIYSLGFRFMFIALPFSFLTVGPIALMSATLAVLLFLILYDYYIID
ncbi:DUF599 family protein, partial [archaeon]